MRSREQFVATIIDQAQKQPEFRDALLKNPKAVLESRLKIKLPESFKVNAVEETTDSLHIVLPAKHEEELSKEELDLVSGGDDNCWDHCNCTDYLL